MPYSLQIESVNISIRSFTGSMWPTLFFINDMAGRVLISLLHSAASLGSVLPSTSSSPAPADSLLSVTRVPASSAGDVLP